MNHYVRIVMLGIEFFIVFVITINIVVFVTTWRYVYQEAENAPKAQVVLIPGAALARGGVPSPIFSDRVNTAVVLYKAGKVTKFLVSGDNSTVAHNEVDTVTTYLRDKGIPDEDIFLDHAGFDTFSSMYRARDVFGATSILIASQSFHLPRAVFIARSLGLEAYGVSADEGHILFTNYLREIFANEKAMFDLAFGREPRYLGDQIPLSGDGRVTHSF
jgi:SanA protein